MFSSVPQFQRYFDSICASSRSANIAACDAHEPATLANVSFQRRGVRYMKTSNIEPMMTD